jgi:O-antigen/teichoic acid export membrane protein
MAHELTEYRAAKNSMVFLFGSIGTRLLALVTFAILTRYLGEHDFGIFTAAVTYLALFGSLLDGGTENILIRDVARSEVELSSRLGSMLLLKLLFAGLAVTLAFLLLPLAPMGAQGHAITLVMLLLFVLSPKFPTIRSVFEAVFRARLRVWFPFVAEIVSALIFLGGLLILVRMQGTLTGVAWLYALTGLPGLVILISGTLPHVRLRIRWDGSYIRTMLIEAWPLAVAGLLITFTARINVLILTGLRTMEEVGHYGAAYRLVEPLGFLPLAIVVSLFPLMSVYVEKDPRQLRHYFNAGFKIAALLSFGVAALLVILAPLLIVLVYGSEFAAATETLQMLGASVPFWFCNVVFLHLVIAIGQQKRSLRVFGVMLVVTIALNLLAIPRWGAAGAAGATVLTELAACSVWVWICRSWIRGDTGRFVAKLTGLHLVVGLGLWALPPLPLIWTALLYCTTAAAFFFVMRCHRDKDIRTFLRAVRRQKNGEPEHG